MFKQVVTGFGILLGLSAAATAQTCPLPAIADAVALKPVAGSNLMTVPVAINGTPKQFLLDISTNPSEISEAAATQLRLPENTQTTDSTQFNMQLGPTGSNSPGSIQTMSASVYQLDGGRSRAELRRRIRIAAFTLGNATGHDLQFAVSDDADLGKSKPYDGRLTGSFFKQYDIEVDFAGRQLNYLTATSCADQNQVAYWPHAAVAAVPMTLWDGKMQVSVTIEGHSIDAILDTGSDRSVMRRDLAEKLFNLKSGTPEMMPAGDLEDGRGERVYVHTFPQISLEGIIANNVPALIQANSMIHNLHREPVLGSRSQFVGEPRIPDLTLGMDVLRQLHLYIAPTQKMLYVTAAGPGKSAAD